MLSVQPAFVSDPQLALWLPLRQLDGASFADRSAYGHLCTRTGAVWGPIATYFDGVNDQITTNKTDAQLGISLAITAMGWANLAAYVNTGGGGDLNGLTIISSWPYGASPRSFQLVHVNVSPKGWWLAVQRLDGTAVYVRRAVDSPYPLTTWAHVVGTYDGAIARLYVNGGEIASVPLAATALNTGTTVYVGRGGRTGYEAYFVGQLDDVRLYRRALYPAEIQRIYLETRGQYA